MSYFAYPYLVTFDDSMAYGTHHFLTNFKFQCAAREALLFGDVIDEQINWREELPGIIMLTRDGYSRNMSAVPVGERVVVIMTFEEPNLCSLRLCFRTISNQGVPVACGYQTVVCIGKNSNQMVELPVAFTQFRDMLEEPCATPSFMKRVTEGGHLADELFPESLCDFADKFSKAPANESYPQIVDLGY